MVNKHIKLIQIIIIALLFIFGLLSIFLFNPKQRELNVIRAKEGRIVQKSMEFQIVVDEFFTDRGAVFMTKSDSLTLIIEHSRNYNYDEPWLNHFIKPGDLIRKRSNSDTLWIYRNNETYYFIIGEYIRKPPH